MLNKAPDFIPRTNYLEKLKPFIDQNLIKVLTGQRRVGKSYFLWQIIDYLQTKKNILPKQIIYLNREDEAYFAIQKAEDLLSWIHQQEEKRQLTTKDKKYVFIDEIQEIKAFEKAVRSLNLRGNYDLYITGSNAELFSTDLATLLTGRCLKFRIHPLSYQEFLKFQDLSNSTKALQQYLHFGSLPYLQNLPLEEEVVFEYLSNVYDSILLKDVVKRHNLRNVSFLENLVKFLAAHVGSLISAKSISDFLKSQQLEISAKSTQAYLHHLTESLLVHKVQRIDVQGRKIFETNQKYFFEDLGIRNNLVGYKEGDFEKILENVVYSQLCRLGYEVYVGQFASGQEIDFVATKKNQRLYVQVAYLLANEKTVQREVGNLLKIEDNYPKLLLSWEPVATDNYQGVEHLGIREFLLSDQF